MKMSILFSGTQSVVTSRRFDRHEYAEAMKLLRDLEEEGRIDAAILLFKNEDRKRLALKEILK